MDTTNTKLSAAGPRGVDPRLSGRATHGESPDVEDARSYE